MIALISVALLLLIIFVKAVADWRHIQSPLFEFLVGGGVLVVWILLFLSHPEEPQRVVLIPWGADVLFPTSPTLLIDHFTWLFVTALAGFAFFCAVTMRGETQLVWILGSISVSMLGVLSENTLTLLFFWTLLDFLWLTTLLRFKDLNIEHNRFVLVFLCRILGPVFLISASFLSFMENGSFSLLEMTPRVGIYILGAALFRLDYWVPSVISGGEGDEKEDLFMVERMAPLAISFLLIARVAEMGVGDISSVPFLILMVISLFGGGSWWWLANDPVQGRGGWTIGLVALSLSASFLGIPQASIAWGLSLILTGNILFIKGVRGPMRVFLSVLFFLGFCGLPFTPLWEGRTLFSQGVIGLVLGLGYGVLFLGALRYMVLHHRDGERFEGFSSILSALGPVSLLVTQFLLGMRLGMFQDSMGFWRGEWWFLVPYATFLPFVLLQVFNITPPDWVREIRVFGGEVLNRLTGAFILVSRASTGLVMSIFKLLEGKGGVIWALLGIFFLLSVLAIRGGG